MNIHTGVAFHYLVNVKSKIGFLVDGTIQYFLNDVNKDHRFDQSVVGGIGVDFPLNKKLNFIFDARFNYGLLEMEKENAFLWGNKNIAFSILTGVQF